MISRCLGRPFPPPPRTLGTSPKHSRAMAIKPTLDFCDSVLSNMLKCSMIVVPINFMSYGWNAGAGNAVMILADMEAPCSEASQDDCIQLSVVQARSSAPREPILYRNVREALRPCRELI